LLKDIHFNFVSVFIHFSSVEILVFTVENTSGKQIFYIFSAKWTASMTFQPRKKASPVEDMLEFVAVETDD